jgi:hypothetical protein
MWDCDGEFALRSTGEDRSDFGVCDHNGPRVEKHSAGQFSRSLRSESRDQARLDIARNRWFGKDANRDQVGLALIFSGLSPRDDEGFRARGLT